MADAWLAISPFLGGDPVCLGPEVASPESGWCERGTVCEPNVAATVERPPRGDLVNQPVSDLTAGTRHQDHGPARHAAIIARGGSRAATRSAAAGPPSASP